MDLETFCEFISPERLQTLARAAGLNADTADKLASLREALCGDEGAVRRLSRSCGCSLASATDKVRKIKGACASCAKREAGRRPDMADMSANDCQITADGPPELSMAGLPSWKDPRAATAVAGLPPGSWNCERYASSKSPCEIAEIAAANSDALVRDTFALADLEIAADLLAELKLKTPTDYVWIAVAIPAMGVSHEYAPDEFAVTYVDGNDDTITVKVKSVGISTELLMQDPAAPGGSKFALCVAPVGTARGAQLTYTDARCACDSLHRSIPAQAREFVFLLIEEPPAGTDLTVEIGGTRYSWGECAGICEPPPACSTVKIGSEADGFNPAEFTLT